MKQNHIQYPIYTAGQLLSSHQLNMSFDYLRHQIMDTNVHTKGCGIISGITLSHQGHLLHISGGALIDPHGVLFKIQGINDIERLPIIKKLDITPEFLQQAEHISIQEALDESYIFALYIAERQRQLLNNCDTDNNIKEISISPLLIPAELYKKRIDLKYALPFNTLHKINVLRNIFSTDDIYRNFEQHYKHNTAQISNFLNELIKTHSKIPNLLGISNFSYLRASIKTFKKFALEDMKLSNIHPKTKHVYWRFGMHLQNIQKAINEFIAAYNDIIAKGYYDNNNVKNHSSFVLLGNPINDNKNYHRDNYIDKTNFKNEQALLQQHYNRLLALLNTYHNSTPRVTKLIPTADRQTKLGKQTVPYIYHNTNTVATYWNAHSQPSPAMYHVYNSYEFSNEQLEHYNDKDNFLLEVGNNTDVNIIAGEIRTLISQYKLTLKVKVIQWAKRPSRFFGPEVSVDKGTDLFLEQIQQHNVFFQDKELVEEKKILQSKLEITNIATSKQKIRREIKNRLTDNPKIMNDNIAVRDISIMKHLKEPMRKDKKEMFRMTNQSIETGEITAVFHKHDTINLIAYKNTLLFPMKL